MYILCICYVYAMYMLCICYEYVMYMLCICYVYVMYTVCIHIHIHMHNRLSVTNDYDCILVMLLELSRNGRLKVTQLSVPTNLRMGVVPYLQF